MKGETELQQVQRMADQRAEALERAWLESDSLKSRLSLAESTATRLRDVNAHLQDTLRKAEDHVKRLAHEVARLKGGDKARVIVASASAPTDGGVTGVEAWRTGTVYDVPDAGGADD